MKKLGIITLALLLTAGLAFGFSNPPAKNVEPTTPVKLASLTTPEAPADEAALTTMMIKETKHDFGKLKMGETGSHTFLLTNTGSNDLVLERVKPSCGCTLADYTKESIAPGSQGYVKVDFPAKKPGVFRKTVSVTSNTEPKVLVLNISGEVVN